MPPVPPPPPPNRPSIVERSGPPPPRVLTATAPKGAAMSDLNNVIRFWRSYWRKATCSACRCLVAKDSIDAHAMYHVARGEGQVRQPGTDLAYNDVTVLEAGERIHVVRTGWVTEWTGPG